MIDIHCHILPCLGDGARSLKQSVEMARHAVEDGIHTIVATPHIKPPFLPPERIASSLSKLNNRLSEEKIPVTVLSGSVINVQVMPPDPEHYLLHNGPYLLVEFPDSHVPTMARDVFFKLNLKGLIPIITHPERNLCVIRNPFQLFDLVNENVKVQVTAESLTGLFGRDAKRCARFLFNKNVVHFLATDVHFTNHRRPILSGGLSVAGQILGKAKAQKLVVENPSAVIDGILLNT